MTGEASIPTPRRSLPALALAALVALSAAAAPGQEGGPTLRREAPPPAADELRPEATFGDEVAVSWILVPVTVRNRRGRYVEGLEREDFRLRVDGREVDFPDFEPRGEIPWSLVFLQDLSGSMANSGKLDSSVAAIERFLDAAKFGDEFALVSFAGPTITVDVPFTDDQEALRDALGRWEAYGKTAIHDAVALVPQLSGESRNLKRGVVLFTDGGDNASRLSAEQAAELVRRAELPVYVLGLESGNPNAGSAERDETFRYADVLNLLATSTGGRYFAIRRPGDLWDAYEAIANELRFQYVLGFETAARGTSRFRSISVTVKKRGTIVTSRKGYRGTRPAP